MFHKLKTTICISISIIACAIHTASSFTSPLRSDSTRIACSYLFNNVSTSSDPLSTKVPFFIQKLPDRPSKTDCESISSLVIDVFFREEAERTPEKRSAGFITKPLILAYLKNLQFGDVRGKRYLLGNANSSMFVARRLKCIGNGYLDPAYGYSISDLNDLGSVYNMDYFAESEKGYEFGEILGFVDVTEKSFGLSGIAESSIRTIIPEEDNDTSDLKKLNDAPIKRKSNDRTMRPVLTNLSVAPSARGSGVGSALVEMCEQVVKNEWSRKYSEIVLEVEEENINAQRFYENRGYVALFSDPTSRRFDASGIILRKERTTKICYRKDLSETTKVSDGDENRFSGIFSADMFFARVKKAIGVN
jgi:ribosomal protein S18 acetylase RimI-like enzyme